MTTKTGKYMVYKMHNAEIGDSVMQFFTPDSSLKKVLERKFAIACLRDRGYEIHGILYVDHETYLNMRLSVTVQDYLDMDKKECSVRDEYEQGKISRDIAWYALEAIQSRKKDILKVLHRQVRRIQREDYDVENEIALGLYDFYTASIL